MKVHKSYFMKHKNERLFEAKQKYKNQKQQLQSIGQSLVFPPLPILSYS